MATQLTRDQIALRRHARKQTRRVIESIAVSVAYATDAPEGYIGSGMRRRAEQAAVTAGVLAEAAARAAFAAHPELRHA